MIMEWLKPTAAPESTELVPIKYRVLVPGMMVICNNAEYGNMLYGFGIGDIIEVMEPSITLPVASYETYDTIPLKDGTSIIAYDAHMRFERAY